MTPPTDPRRPPSEELSWELLKRIETFGAHPNLAVSSPMAQLLCRAIRSLCAERDELAERVRFGVDPEFAAKILAQLSAYVTAAEGRPASELIAPSEVKRIIQEWDESRARAQLGAETAAHAIEALSAEIERLRAQIAQMVAVNDEGNP